MSFDQDIFKEIKPHILKTAIKFHQENPHIYKLVRKFANEALASGRERFGIAMIWERMRWFLAFETTDQLYKVNNNYKAFYVRMLMLENPRFKEVFSRKVTNK